MPSRFATRSAETEIMDDLDCAGEVVNQTLRELDTINQLLGGNRVTLSGVRKLLSHTPQETISLVDLGCGSGDMLRLVAQWGRKKKITFQLEGIDANANIIRFAQQHTSAFSEIDYSVQNIFSSEFTQRNFDIVIAALFTHHFTNRQLIELLQSLRKRTRVGIVINDIHRHWFAYYSIRLLTQLFSRSAMVKFDAPLSVLRAFKKKELREILHQAGIEHYTLKWKWAFRWQLIIPSSLA